MQVIRDHAEGVLQESWKRCSAIVLERFPTQGRGDFASLSLEDYNDHVAAIPAEALEGGDEAVMQYQAPPRQAAEPTVHAHTTNPLALFLSTLIPWYVCARISSYDPF